MDMNTNISRHAKRALTLADRDVDFSRLTPTRLVINGASSKVDYDFGRNVDATQWNQFIALLIENLAYKDSLAVKNFIDDQKAKGVQWLDYASPSNCAGAYRLDLPTKDFKHGLALVAPEMKLSKSLSYLRKLIKACHMDPADVEIKYSSRNAKDVRAFMPKDDFNRRVLQATRLCFSGEEIFLCV